MTKTLEEVEIPASDGLKLAGTQFLPESSSRGQIILASAMATPRSFYREFARWLAQEGFSVLSFDYRGTGDSFPEDLTYSEITIEDWANRDIPGAVTYAGEHFPPGPRYVVAHSLPGTIVGMNGNDLDLNGLATFCSQSGYWKIQHPNQRHKLLLASYVIFPLLNTTVGYLPWSKLFGGEDVPPIVARQWYRSCRFPNYFLDNDSVDNAARYTEFSAPILAYSFEDDEWGYRRAVDRMVSAYENAPVTRIHVKPGDTNFDSIGHFGFFDPDKEPLWEEFLERLESL